MINDIIFTFYSYFIKARKGTIASKLYKKINKLDPCHVFNAGKIGNFISKDHDKIFLLVYDIGWLLKNCFRNEFINSF